MKRLSDDLKQEPCTLLFVVGNSRSGTTMMGRILNMNANVFTFHELHFFEQMWTADDKGKLLSPEEADELFAKLIKTERKGYLSEGSWEEYLDEAARTVDKFSEQPLTGELIFKNFLIYESTLNKKKIPCDQTPRNILYAKDILELYKEAKIINLIRDPRDILLSQKNKWKRKFLGATNIPYKESIRAWANYHPITISKLWQMNVACADKLSTHPRFLNVQYESMLTNQETELKRICDFIGIDFFSEMLQIPHVGSSNASDRKQSKGINPGNTGTWKKGGLTKTEVFFSQYIAGSAMSRLNYSIENINPNIVYVLVYLGTFPFKIGISFLFNLGRMKNISQALRRRFSFR